MTNKSAVGIAAPPPLDSVNLICRISTIDHLPEPEPNKKNHIGQQRHQTEMRSGGVIAYRVPLHQKMAVGALSGVIGICTVFPVDLIKTRLQLAQSAATATTGTTGAVAISRAVSIRSVCSTIYAQQGIAGFYRGLGTTALGMMPEKAIKLGVNDFLRDIFCDYDRTRETMGQQVTAGALTAVVQVLATNPMEVMKIRLQMVDGSSSPLAVAKELGFRGLFNGITVTWMRDIPYNVIFFMTYIQLKRMLTSPNGHVSQDRVFGSGVAAGVVAAWAGTPMDVVKSRIQMANSPYTSGAVDCMRRLHGEGGWRIFFRGAVPRMVVQGPLYGISLLLFELLNDYNKGCMPTDKQAGALST